ncbi:hypothetical protein BDF14DRAFT_1741911 [Spinellus fusiger]|nr:hypothetical protein BDF14DRAFT_1741911 [Spinellus fusiger]
MTDYYMAKAVVKLPRKRQDSIVDTMATRYQHLSILSPPLPTNCSSVSYYDQYLVSNTIYFVHLPLTVSKNEVYELVKSCEVIEIHTNRCGDQFHGYLRFPSREKADRAYTLFNGAVLRSGACLQLRIHSPESNIPEPEPSAGILQIKNLPSHTSNQLLYDLFRPYGPMSICKILVEQGYEFKGTALILYFRPEDASYAESIMANTNLQGSMITIHPYVSKALSQPVDYDLHSTAAKSCLADGQAQRATQSSHDAVMPPETPSSQVDFTNLYIKNLDLNVTSKDLFSHFRQFGHIISARVMKDKSSPVEKSKGFGFVSFSKAEEAQKAMEEMNNKYIMSKPVVVAFHAPRKIRKERTTTNTTNISRPTDSPLSSLVTNSNFDPGVQGHHSMPLQLHSHEEKKHASSSSSSSPLPPPLPPGPRSCAPVLGSPIPCSTFPSPPDYLSSKYTTFSSYTPQSRSIGNGYFNSYNNVNSGLAANPQYLAQNHSLTNDKTTNPSLKASAPNYTKPHTTLHRRDSSESIMSTLTTSTSSLQRAHMTRAVSKCGEIHNVNDIVDLLLTLNRKERSLCLFNGDFLRGRIEHAKSAIEVFSDQDMAETPMNATMTNTTHTTTTTVMTPMDKKPTSLGHGLFPEKLDHGNYTHWNGSYLPQQHPYPSSLMLNPNSTFNNNYPTTISTTLLGDLSLPPRTSRAIPIVPPPSQIQQQQQASSLHQEKPLPPTEKEKEDIKSKALSLLESLTGLTGHEQKQRLGDKLFPLVKATGVKYAPKITIRLLDTIALEELAYSMYDKEKLTKKVNTAASFLTIVRQQ